MLRFLLGSVGFSWVLLVSAEDWSARLRSAHQEKVFLNLEFSTPGAKIVSILSIIRDRP
jgi:hypothetical protein